MKDRPVIALAAGLVLLGSLTAIILTLRGGSVPVDSGIQELIGQHLAREAVKHLGPGRHLTVLARDTAMFSQPAADLVVASFTREAGRAGATVTGIQRFEVDPLRPAQVPPGDFLELIRRSTPGDVIVSLLGPPLLSEEQRTQLPAVPGCRIIALCAGPFPDAASLRQLAAQNLLHAAIIDRPQTRGTPPSKSRGRETFEELYTLFQPSAGTPGPGASPTP